MDIHNSEFKIITKESRSEHEALGISINQSTRISCMYNGPMMKLVLNT